MLEGIKGSLQVSSMSKCSTQDNLEAYPFAVDGHHCVSRNAQVVYLRNLANFLHIRSIASRAKDDRDFGIRVDVVRRDKGPSGVVNERRKCDRELLGHGEPLVRGRRRRGTTYIFGKGLAEHFRHVMAFRVECPKAFGPPDENAMVDFGLTVGGVKPMYAT